MDVYEECYEVGANEVSALGWEGQLGDESHLSAVGSGRVDPCVLVIVSW